MLQREVPVITAPHEFGTAVAKQVEIPVTTPDSYITGIYALNVQSPEGTSGDWHDVFHWRDGIDRPRVVALGGDGSGSDTNPFLGHFGVYEGRDRLVGMGLELPAGADQVFLANHFRAILDLLYRSINKFGIPVNLTGVTDDWLDTDEQKALLFEEAAHLAPGLSQDGRQALAQWINSERLGKYAAA